jgi:hypothetical protein
MAHRLLPFRQYSDHEVINLFSVNLDRLPSELKLMAPNDDGINADGVLMQVRAGNMAENDVVTVGEDGRFQGATAPPVGRNPYPTVPLQVEPCKGISGVIGMTLAQTLSHDENSENLLYNPVKKDELNAVLSGQAVPLATRGVFTLTEKAFDVTATDSWAEVAPGSALTPSASNAEVGKFKASLPAAGGQNIGSVLATGERVDNGSADNWSGPYAVIQLRI